MSARRPAPRLALIPENQMNARQRALREAIRSGPRAKFKNTGPFAVWMHTPEFGELAQRLGAHCRYKTALPPRLSEFAILVTARLWRAQYEWQAHAPMAERAGVKRQTIKDLRTGRHPKAAPKDERAIYDFIKELYRTRRVSERSYVRVRAFLDDAAMVEFVGILGYYVMISMTLNVFRMLPAQDVELPFGAENAR